MRILCNLLVSSTLLAQSSNAPRAMPLPALPYYDLDACPFEGCVYREWTALEPAVVYDTYKEKRREVARLTAGDKVTALTGVVITFRPGVIRVDRDLKEQGLRRGDRILTYTYRGEGFFTVWMNGHFYSEMDVSFASGPGDAGCHGNGCAGAFLDYGKHSWWARVRTRSGVTGWLLAEGKFDGQDLLAE